MNVKKVDIAICGILSAILCVFLYELRGITPIARVYPMFIIIGSFVMIAIVLYQSIRPSKKQAVDTEQEPPLEKGALRRIAVYGAAILAYVLLINPLGYILSTILFAVFSLVYQKNRNKLVIVGLPVVMALLMYVVFAKFLYVFLPVGTLIDKLL